MKLMASNRPSLSEGERERLQMFILDVLKYDIENVESILKLLNDRDGIGWRFAWPHDFDKQEVVCGLQNLLRMELIQALTFDDSDEALIEAKDKGAGLPENPEAYWFALTEIGRHALASWTDYPMPPEEDNA
jgi:hypothetical protein